MRKLIVALAAVVALVMPAAAQAWPTNIETYGINSSCKNTDQEIAIEQYVAAIADYHIRCFLDKRLADANGGVNAYYKTNDALLGLAHNQVGVIAGVIWTDSDAPGGRHDIDNATERGQWRTFVKEATAAVNSAYATYGVAKPGAIEVWNEPNCDSAIYPTLDDWWTNVYVPAQAGVRDSSSDTNVVVGGLSASSNSPCSNDAWSWITNIIDRGYSSLVNAYAVTAYGFSIPGDTNQGADIAQELATACGPANRKLLLTETGVSSADGHTEAYQRDQTRLARDTGYRYTRARSNWPGVDKASGFTPYRRTMGLWTAPPNYVAKLAEADWDSWAGFAGKVGALDNTGTC